MQSFDSEDGGETNKYSDNGSYETWKQNIMIHINCLSRNTNRGQSVECRKRQISQRKSPI